MIFARSVDFVQPSSTSNTSVIKPVGRPLSEERQEKSVSYVASYIRVYS